MPSFQRLAASSSPGRCSTIVTSAPWSASRQAVRQPAMPPPITTTSGPCIVSTVAVARDPRQADRPASPPLVGCGQVVSDQGRGACTRAPSDHVTEATVGFYRQTAPNLRPARRPAPTSRCSSWACTGAVRPRCRVCCTPPASSGHRRRVGGAPSREPPVLRRTLERWSTSTTDCWARSVGHGMRRPRHQIRAHLPTRT